MVRTYVVAGTVMAALIGFAGSSPQAQEQEGLATLHSWVRIGNRTCMADHFHSGSSAGQPSKKAAEFAAVNSWASFTAWEYGDHWGRWRLAETKRVKCDRDGTTWGCAVEARPCKLNARSR